MLPSLQLSLLIPLLNEEESLFELTNEIRTVCNKHNISYEVIFVDDGSTDNSWTLIQQLFQENPNIKGIKFRKNFGKAIALNEGFKIVRGDIVITMDADLQDSPDEIPDLMRMMREENFDLVSGWKKVRYDNVLTKNLPSKFYNWVTRKMTKIPLHDFNCGLKAYKNKVIKNIELYGDMHRYIPVIAKSEGFKKIGEKVVMHRVRKYGVSKYGWERFVNGFLDLLTIRFMSKFGKRPMHFFGSIGSLFFFTGALILIEFLIEKLFFNVYEINKRPLFSFAILSCIIGMQLFLAGFISELVVRNNVEKSHHHCVEELLNCNS